MMPISLSRTNVSYVALILISIASVDSITIYWHQLASQLSSEDAFQLSRDYDWINQCVHPFADIQLAPQGSRYYDEYDAKVSNYQLFRQPSGLCAAHMSCAYEKCDGPLPKSDSSATYNSSIFSDEFWKSDVRLNLPDAVVHPRHVGDVSTTIAFASHLKVGISVKTSGHSFTGSSTKKGTILLNLSELQKYSPSGSIVECQADLDARGAYRQACDMAIARNKQAVIRVGGGEIWDEVLHSVNIEWNEKGNHTRKYHIVSAAAGTVSAAGGWLASGGLSGNNAMRLYGLGIDQVLHVEMVLPNSLHVRFGPAEWIEDANRKYPITKEISGFCNLGDLSNEELWDWKVCEDEIDFNELWYAVRGGGGGAYGVVTSIYYQLHDFSPMQIADMNMSHLARVVRNDSLKIIITLKWVEFILRYFFDPVSVGVTEFASNSCSSPSTGGFLGGNFICFNGAADIMKDAWGKFYGNELSNLSYPINDYFSVNGTYTSWAHKIIDEGIKDPNVPIGRGVDGQRPLLNTPFGPVSGIDTQYLVFPKDSLVRKREELIPKLTSCVLNIPGCSLGGQIYIMGGMIPSTNDGMNSLPIHLRRGGLLMVVTDTSARTEFQRVFYGVKEGEAVIGDSFPGALCHNFASADYLTPLKDDWTRSCNPKWSEKEKKKKCLSYQETAWGTVILKKLERIHSTIDPFHIFDCWDCVGYSGAAVVRKATKRPKGHKKGTFLRSRGVTIEPRTKASKSKKKGKIRIRTSSSISDLYYYCTADLSLIGNGFCDGPEFNTTECFFDGGDCI